MKALFKLCVISVACVAFLIVGFQAVESFFMLALGSLI